MGILNITPDSFSDARLFSECSVACQRALQMVKQGADIIDIGGESSRPGAQAVSVAEEIARVVPVIEALRQVSDVCISIDTYKPDVMKAAVHAGASLINDIMALRHDGALIVAQKLGVPVCLMHMQGLPETMQQAPSYSQDMVSEINQFFEQRIAACERVGISREHLILDPGFGFGKTVAHNLELVRRFAEFKTHQLPLLLGVSRKSTIGLTLNKPVHERLIGGITLSVLAVLQGATILRTHDIEETRQALQMLEAIKG